MRPLEILFILEANPSYNWAVVRLPHTPTLPPMALPANNEGKSFDKFSFIKYMKNIGRAYRKQAMELVSVCRLFVQVQKQTPASDATLRR